MVVMIFRLRKTIVRASLLSLVCIGVVLALPTDKPSFAQLFSRSPKPLSHQPVVGCLLPLSGRYRLIGQRALMGILTAARPLQSEHGARVGVMDSEIGKAKLRGDLSSLISEEGVSFLIGPIIGDLAGDVGRSISSLRVPTVVFPLSEKDYSESSYFIKFSYPLEKQARVLGDFTARDLEIETFAVIYPNTRPGRILRDVFRYTVRLYGGRVVYEKTTQAFKEDYETEIEWIKKLLPEAVFIPDSAQYSAQLILKLRGEEEFEDTVFLGPNTWNSSTFYKSVGRDLEGIIFTDYFYPGSSRWVYFVNRFREMFGEDPGFLEYQVFEAASIVLEAYRESKYTGGRDVIDRLMRKGDNSFYEIARSFGKGVFISPRPLLLTLERGEVVDIGSAERLKRIRETMYPDVENQL